MHERALRPTRLAPSFVSMGLRSRLRALNGCAFDSPAPSLMSKRQAVMVMLVLNASGLTIAVLGVGADTCLC